MEADSSDDDGEFAQPKWDDDDDDNDDDGSSVAGQRAQGKAKPKSPPKSTSLVDSQSRPNGRKAGSRTVVNKVTKQPQKSQARQAGRPGRARKLPVARSSQSSKQSRRSPSSPRSSAADLANTPPRQPQLLTPTSMVPPPGRLPSSLHGSKPMEDRLDSPCKYRGQGTHQGLCRRPARSTSDGPSTTPRPTPPNTRRR